MNKFLHSTILVSLGLLSQSILASDHDDGENDRKARALNLTDVYAFRKDSQTGNGSDSDKMILIMNSNPRSLPQQQYYFSTEAHYDFHLSRIGKSSLGAKNIRPAGSEDIRLRLTFGEPNAQKKQKITLLSSVDGAVTTNDQKVGGGDIMSTPLGTAPINSTVTLGGEDLLVFAGLRQDPFFFDVQGFFKFRSTLNPAFLQSDDGDFTLGYNVNTIALEVPMDFLQASSNADVYDVWVTISVPIK